MACIVQIRVISRNGLMILVLLFEPLNILGLKNMTIGDRLNEERLRLGLSQTDLGAPGGVGKTTQINYEKGAGSPDANYLAAGADLGIDVLYVVTGERKPTAADSISADTAKFLGVYQQISETDREVLFRMASAFATAARIDMRMDHN